MAKASIIAPGADAVGGFVLRLTLHIQYESITQITLEENFWESLKTATRLPAQNTGICEQIRNNDEVGAMALPGREPTIAHVASISVECADCGRNRWWRPDQLKRFGV
ncbi:MAG: hypothetical protein E5W26_32360, partial [Mesorhizobium sp.]